jgi:hypothetical protein
MKVYGKLILIPCFKSMNFNYILRISEKKS